MSIAFSLVHGEWVCECPDFFYLHVTSKHVYATKFYLTFRYYVNREILWPRVLSADARLCVRCGSIRVIRYGRSDSKQVFKCKGLREEIQGGVASEEGKV